MTKVLVVNREDVKSNLRTIKRAAGESVVIGVLKGNAYGLGLAETALMMREEGVSFFAVTEPADLAKLRDAGFCEEEVLVMRSTALASELEMIIDGDGIATIGSYDAAVAADEAAKGRGVMLPAHIAIDTGMGRYGFQSNETDKVLSVFRYMKNLHITGMYTHFNEAFRRGRKGERMVARQLESLKRVAALARAEGFDVGLLHAANSPALFRFPETRLDAVRIGSAYTGRLITGGDKLELKKVGQAQCRVVEIRTIAAGSTVGYGSAYKAKKSMKIAVIPFGYADGFCLEKARDKYTLGATIRYILQDIKACLTHKRITVKINGRPCRVLGHVGMLHTVCDITNEETAVGALATFDINPIVCGNILPKRYE